MEVNAVVKSYIQNTPDIQVTEVSGGLVHKVYRVSENESSYYIKVRGASFSGIPELSSIPHEIEFERRGLEIFGGMMPDLFPCVIDHNESQGILVMTDILPNGGETLHQRILREGITTELASNIGQTVGYAHRTTKEISTTIRDGNDESFFRNLLEFRFGSIPSPRLRHFISELLDEPRGIIIGGLSPKNILVGSDDSIKFCDLETVCQGNRLFDVGYCLGHLILHALPYREKALSIYKSFFNAYMGKETESVNKGSIARLVAATVLYRVDNKLVPYKLVLPEGTKRKISSSAISFLSNWGDSLDDLILSL